MMMTIHLSHGVEVVSIAVLLSASVLYLALRLTRQSR
jgi:hypothetical protein